MNDNLIIQNEEKNLKLKLLRDIGEFIQYGIRPTKNYTLSNSLEELKYEYKILKYEFEKQKEHETLRNLYSMIAILCIEVDKKCGIFTDPNHSLVKCYTDFVKEKMNNTSDINNKKRKGDYIEKYNDIKKLKY